MRISKWESFLEKHIEGFFTKKFGSALELPEVFRKLEREVHRKKKKGTDVCKVPNVYQIHVSPIDYQQMSAQRVIDELRAVVEKTVIAADVFLDGKLQVLLQKDTELSQGMCEVRSFYAAEKSEKTLLREPHTMVLERTSFKAPLNLPTVNKIVSLTVLEGPDVDAYLEFGEKQIYIGRRESNDFILTDTNTSRLHAYITFERHRHVLHDAQSLNGTWVNQEKITSVCLCPGDEIQVGNTVLVYEVI